MHLPGQPHFRFVQLREEEQRDEPSGELQDDQQLAGAWPCHLETGYFVAAYSFFQIQTIPGHLDQVLAPERQSLHLGPFPHRVCTVL